MVADILSQVGGCGWDLTSRNIIEEAEGGCDLGGRVDVVDLHLSHQLVAAVGEEGVEHVVHAHEGFLGQREPTVPSKISFSVSSEIVGGPGLKMFVLKKNFCSVAAPRRLALLKFSSTFVIGM